MAEEGKGTRSRENEKIMEVETDKATMEMEAFAGTLAVIVAKEGDKVAVGAVIAVLAGAKENAADVKNNIRPESRRRLRHQWRKKLREERRLRWRLLRRRTQKSCMSRMGWWDMERRGSIRRLFRRCRIMAVMAGG